MCCGAAKGMLHLHAHSVLHRDLKSGTLQPFSIIGSNKFHGSALAHSDAQRVTAFFGMSDLPLIMAGALQITRPQVFQYMALQE